MPILKPRICIGLKVEHDVSGILYYLECIENCPKIARRQIYGFTDVDNVFEIYRFCHKVAKAWPLRN